ncbi:MAG: histidinol-phosphate transaminase [Pseudomonadota bacterium]|nr:histidinol-phosphate transaminase [Pseudomonadota bacterium]
MSQHASRPEPRAELMAITTYVPGKSAPAGAAKTYKLSSNESPLGPSPKAAQALRDAAAALAFYPDGSAEALRRAIGERHGLDPARLICGDGSDELLGLFAHAFLKPGDDGLYSQYGFLSYPIAIRAAGATPIAAPERHYCADVDALLARVSDRTKLVFLANPNNPTGSMLPRGELKRLHAGLPPDALFVIDAAYAEYVEDAAYEPGVELVDSFENVVMTRTFSKAYGLAGARLGWAYGREFAIEALNRIRGPFNVNAPAQAAGVAALGDPGHLAAAVAHNARWLPWLRREIGALGLEVPPSAGNFVLIRFRDAGEARRADAALTLAGFILRGMDGYGLPDCLRLTVGEEEANTGVVAALKRFLAV